MSRYPKQFWQSGTILAPFGPVSGGRLQHIEDWLDTIFGDFDAHAASGGDPHTQYLLEPVGAVGADKVVVRNAADTLWIAQKLTNAQIDVAAAIARSKLDFGAGLVNADIAAAAAILRSKLDFGTGLTNADIAAAAAILTSKLNISGARNGTRYLRDDDSWADLPPAPQPGYGTSFPASPTNGQEFILVDSVTTPTYAWRFRYNAGSTYADKWEYIGGDPAIVEVTNDDTTNSLTYVALANAGPSFTVPRAGVYNISVENTSVVNTAGAGMFHSLDMGGTAAVDADALRSYFADAGLGGRGTSKHTIQRTLSASTALVSKYRVGAASTAHFQNRRLIITPKRCS